MLNYLTIKTLIRIVLSIFIVICFLLFSGTLFENIRAIQTEITPVSITLIWTAPGDNGNTGTAWRYDVRYDTEEITEANWSYASQATGEPTPGPAGSSEEFTVEDLAPNTLYYFAIKTADLAGNWSALSNNDTASTLSLGSSIIVPDEYELEQNYPNPFNASTVISYYVPAPGPVKLSVYDILGRTVSTIVDDELSVGEHTARWDGLDGDGKTVATGVYFYHLRAGDYNTSRKMLLLK